MITQTNPQVDQKSLRNLFQDRSIVAYLNARTTRTGGGKTASLTVLICRVAIGMTGLHWYSQGETLQFAVSLGALALSVVPGVLVRDRPVRNVASATAAVLLATHIVFGMFGGLYETSSIYDKTVHVLGSMSIAGLLAFAVRRYCNYHLIRLPLILVALIVLAGTLSAGAFWELFEFAVDRTGMFYAQRGLTDTMLDLLADLGGAVIMIGMLWIADSVRPR